MKLRRFFWQSLTAFSILLIAHLATFTAVSQGTNSTLAGMIAAALVSVALAIYLAHRIGRPLENLLGRVEQVAAGNLNEIVDLSGNETLEIHQISTLMDSIAAQLNSRIDLIRTQKEEQEAILQSLDEGLIAIDGDRRISHLNPAALRIFDDVPNLAVGNKIEEVLRQSDLQTLIVKSMQMQAPLEKDIEFLGEKNRYLRVHTSPLRGALGRHRGLVLAVNDVTRIRQLEGMRKNFVANVSHELRTPLTSIQGFAETLMNPNVQDPKEIRRFIEIIQRHATRLSRIIEDILTLSRIERDSESHQIDKKPESVKSIVEAALELCQVRASRKQTTITQNISGDVTIGCDRYLLEQALVNLIDNAVRYSDPGKNVEVSVREAGPDVIISVRDEGVGLAKNQLGKIFERFYRVDRARSREMGGTGLGLSIVKHIMLAHQGHVEVQSELGKGSEFRLVLPKTVTAPGS